jgi:cytoskeletal protein CcmA (bactofilin family)
MSHVNWFRFFRKKETARPDRVSGQKQFVTGGFRLKGILLFPSGGSLACPLEGDIVGRARTVIASSGVLKGDAWSDHLTVEGDAEGRILVSGELHVARDGRFRGRCTAGSLIVEDDSFLNADIELRPDATTMVQEGRKSHPGNRAA